MKTKQQMYWVKREKDGVLSMAGFVMWTDQKKYAKKYTIDQAKELINAISPHMGNGVLVEVT